MNIKTSITPFLVVASGKSAVKFYQDGMGATILERFDQPDGRLSAKLEIAGAEFFVADEEPDFDNYGPGKFGGSPVRIVLITDKPETIYQGAIDKGAQQICPVTTEEDWKIGKLRDPFGHIWEIGHPLNQ